MAKTKNAACDGCGAAVWPNSHHPRPWLCMKCRHPRQAAPRPAPVWRLANSAGSTISIVLEPCSVCGAMPEVAATHPELGSPRAIAWPHRGDCAALSTRDEDAP